MNLELLSMLAAGPILGGKIGEWEHTFCEDCENWTIETAPSNLGLCALLNPHLAKAHPEGWVVRSGGHTPGDGPLWPGCRGFKLRPGALGPMKRYAQAVRDKTNAMLEREGGDPWEKKDL